jgi:enoyl-CoA hydratase/carnithine racemase
MAVDTGTGSEVLLVERVGTVSVLTMNRPEARNALDPELIDALKGTLAAAVEDDAVRAVVLTGAGDRAFCAGMDLKGFVAQGDASSEGSAADGIAGHVIAPVIPWDLGVPLIGAINGAAVAGGFELMMSCDVVVAAEHAFFGLSEVKRGLIPGGGGTVLGSRVPPAIALEMCLTGDNIDAPRALAAGLVNRVVPADQVRDEALAIAKRIAANGPLAVAAIKALMRRGELEGAAAAWPDSDTLQRIFASDDAREGAMAFIEKRDPKWTGR